MTIGVPLSALICRQTSMPSVPGSIRSSRTRSGLVARNADSARSPSATNEGSKPSVRRTMPSISASAGSSSTTSTRPLDTPPWSHPEWGATFRFASVAVAVRLERAFHRHADVVGLVVGEGAQLDAQGVEVEPSDLLVEVLGQDVDPDWVVVGLVEELQLRDGLVGEAVGHDERRVAGGVAEVEQATLRQHQDRVTVAEDPFVDLRLDVVAAYAGKLREAGHVDLVVEVPDVADDRALLHPLHVGGGDDVEVAGRRDEDVGGLDHIVEGRDLVSVHRRLQRADRVDLGDDDTSALAAERLCAALADFAEAEHDRHLAAEHHVGCPVESVDERMPATVDVVELALGDRI